MKENNGIKGNKNTTFSNASSTAKKNTEIVMKLYKKWALEIKDSRSVKEPRASHISNF